MNKEQFEEKYGKQLKLSEKKWMLMSSRANKENNLVIVSGYREIDYDYLYFIYKDEVWEMFLDGNVRYYDLFPYTTRELFQLVLDTKKSIEYFPPGNKILYIASGVKGQVIVALDYFATKIKSVLDPVITVKVPKEVWGSDFDADVQSTKHILEELEEFLTSLGYYKSIIDYVLKNTDVLFIKQGGEWDMGYLDALIENAKFEEMSNIIPTEQDKKAKALLNEEWDETKFHDFFGHRIDRGALLDNEIKQSNNFDFKDHYITKAWDILKKSNSEEVLTKDPVFKVITNNICELLEYKNNKYGNSALNPLEIFTGKSKTGSRLDDKLARVKNSEKLQKNDIADIIGYLILVCKENNWTTFDEFKD